jgi:DNA-binding transcriptional ArsR family regulator
MLDQIRRDIQARLQDLLDEIDKLRRALAALTSRESEPDRGDHAAPVAGSVAAGESAAESSSAGTARAPRARKASVPPRPTTPAPASSAGAGAPARTAPGATKAAVLEALKDAGAMTAGEIAAATGLGRATVSTTLSKLASSGEITKAPRGYQLQRESGTTRKPPRPRPSVTAATSPSLPVAELLVAEELVGEAPAAGAARPVSGATKRAVLGALAGGSAMTAGEVAAATGLARASVSTTLSKLAKAGELTKAARGYQLAGAESSQRFYFRTEDAGDGAVVGNVPELEAAIAVCEAGVFRAHCAERDFSRWVVGVLRNEPLAAEIAAVEAQLSADSPTEIVEHARQALIAALQARHATEQ